jgi:hypothetical protein
MSRWKQHMTQPAKQELVGETVGSMKILEEGSDANSLKLECCKCHTSFWFDDAQGGRNAVRRPDDKGIPEVHAKCPKCGAEWDGDIRRYYSIGFVQLPPDEVKDMGRKMHLPDAILDSAMVIMIVDAVEAENPIEAIKAAIIPTDLPESITSQGIACVLCEEDTFNHFQQNRSLRDLHRQASGHGSIVDFLREVLGGNPKKGNGKARFQGGPAGPPVDKSAQDVLDSMNDK